MGSAMNLVAGVQRIIVIIEHVNKHNKPKIFTNYSLPLTGKGFMARIITELAILDNTEQGLKLVGLIESVSFDEWQ